MSQKKVHICFGYWVNATILRGAGGVSIGSLALGNLVAMERFSGADRALCVREFYKNGNSATAARRKFCSIRHIRHLNDAPSTRLIARWVEKFEETGSTLEKPKSGRPRSSRTVKNVESVAQSIREDPNISIRKRAVALNVHRSSLCRILHKDLKLHPYKIQLVQELKPQAKSSWNFSWQIDLEERWHKLASTQSRFDTYGLFPVGLSQIQSLRQQTDFPGTIKRKYPSRNRCHPGEYLPSRHRQF